jgi:hypothetical protein
MAATKAEDPTEAPRDFDAAGWLGFSVNFLAGDARKKILS